MQMGLDKTYWIAYSGGLDSHVLLSLCSHLRDQWGIKCRAIHINHHLSPHALSWLTHCKKICEDYAITCTFHTLHIDPASGDSLEEIAREKRYAFFAECLSPGDVLLTAHHQDDQAETVLLQLLRGAGLKGLAGMPSIKSFAQGFHCRPLLPYSRSDLAHYAAENQLKWIEDESNADLKFTRNFIRHKILAQLKKRFPSASATLARSAAYCAESQNLLETFAKELCVISQGTLDNTLSVTKLIQLTSEKQRLVLRQWILSLGFPLPDSKKIKTIQLTVLTSSWDSLPCVHWGGVELRRYRDDLYLLPALREHDHQQTYEWDLVKPLPLAGVGELQATQVIGGGLRADLSPISIRFRQGGEIVDVPNRGRHTLKNLFQEWNILPWERSRIPLLFAKDQFIGVVGYFIAKDFVAKPGDKGHEISLRKVCPSLPSPARGEGAY